MELLTGGPVDRTLTLPAVMTITAAQVYNPRYYSIPSEDTAVGIAPGYFWRS